MDKRERQTERKKGRLKRETERKTCKTERDRELRQRGKKIEKREVGR